MNNKEIIKQLKKEFEDYINSCLEDLEDNEVELKSIRINQMELAIKVHNEDNEYLEELDCESDNDGNEYFIQI